MHGHQILQWNNALLNPRALQEYATTITAQGSPLDNCFGFIDGTVRPISKPGQNQHMVYNGHKRIHAINFHSIALPNGMIGNMFGPIKLLVSYIKRHDAAMLRDSHLLDDLQQFTFSPGPVMHPMCLYGDPAYPLRRHLQALFQNIHLTVQILCAPFIQLLSLSCLSYSL